MRHNVRRQIRNPRKLLPRRLLKYTLWGLCCFGVMLLLGCQSTTNQDEQSQDRIAPTETVGNETTAPAAPVQKADPVTIKLGWAIGAFALDEFERYIIKPAKVKYPHITVERVDIPNSTSSLEELVAAKEPLDLYLNATLNLPTFLALNLDSNIEPTLKENAFNPERIIPEITQSILDGTERAHLIGLPIYNQAFGLLYNKTLFDRFGEDYPVDGMSWEEVRMLASKLTRSVEGTEYYGLYPDRVFRGAYQLGLDWIDLDNDRAVFETDAWQRLFRFWAGLMQTGIPPKGTNYANEFYAGNIAMISGTTGMVSSQDLQGLDWDVVTYPYHPDQPGVGQRVDSFNLMLTSTSEHRTEAFQIMEMILSDEVQLEMSLQGRMSVLQNRSIQEQYGANVAALSGKNVQAFTKPVLAPLKTLFNLPAHTFVNDALFEVIYDGKDMNTALREANEKMNQAIAQKLQAE